MMTWLISGSITLVAFVAAGVAWRIRTRRRRVVVSHETPADSARLEPGRCYGCGSDQHLWAGCARNPTNDRTRGGRRRLDQEWLGHVHPDAAPARPPRGVTHGYGAVLYFGRNLARRQARGEDPSGLPGGQLYRRGPR